LIQTETYLSPEVLIRAHRPLNAGIVLVAHARCEREHLSEQFLNTSASIIAPAPPLAIAGNSDGAIFLTGRAPGKFALGTNVSAGGENAFVMRQSTLKPTLKSEQIGTNIIFSWPRAAFPFALQQSNETGTNWLSFHNHRTCERALGKSRSLRKQQPECSACSEQMKLQFVMCLAGLCSLDHQEHSSIIQTCFL